MDAVDGAGDHVECLISLTAPISIFLSIFTEM